MSLIFKATLQNLILSAAKETCYFNYLHKQGISTRPWSIRPYGIPKNSIYRVGQLNDRLDMLSVGRTCVIIHISPLPVIVCRIHLDFIFHNPYFAAATADYNLAISPPQKNHNDSREGQFHVIRIITKTFIIRYYFQNNCYLPLLCTSNNTWVLDKFDK